MLYGAHHVRHVTGGRKLGLGVCGLGERERGGMCSIGLSGLYPKISVVNCNHWGELAICNRTHNHVQHMSDKYRATHSPYTANHFSYPSLICNLISQITVKGYIGIVVYVTHSGDCGDWYTLVLVVSESSYHTPYSISHIDNYSDKTTCVIEYLPHSHPTLYRYTPPISMVYRCAVISGRIINGIIHTVYPAVSPAHCLCVLYDGILPENSSLYYVIYGVIVGCSQVTRSHAECCRMPVNTSMNADISPWSSHARCTYQSDSSLHQ